VGRSEDDKSPRFVRGPGAAGLFGERSNGHYGMNDRLVTCEDNLLLENPNFSIVPSG